MTFIEVLNLRNEELFLSLFFAAGYYMYIETSGWIAIGSKAWFISPSYQPASRTGGKCMQFWYHMYGNSIGQLNVYLKTTSGYPGTKVWTMSQNQGNQWLIGQVKITTSSSFNVSRTFEF